VSRPDSLEELGELCSTPLDVADEHCLHGCEL
jgi:hypothetical protein